ncbi:MAG: M23 family metallopeptidase [Rikenellaceae bacterium]|jgi:hypothetical protein|nr:M23 family metallopeptidase [Rikenellaceae bacterium]
MRNILLIAAVLGCGALFGQPKAEDFRVPVDIPVILSGNVGEIRANHFHTGLDIKTGGETGKNILAAADGYVSRISVSPTGYGKALYINHPNGTTTVYAHLESFNEPIGQYVRAEQERRKSFAVELYPPSGRLMVTQGEVIALSGNSGSSGGPHLHYEIRDGASQDPFNLMGRGWFPGVADNVRPQLFTLWSIHVDTLQGVPVHRIAGEYKLVASGAEYAVEGGKPVAFVSPGYFAIEVIDRKNGASNTLGLYRLEQTVDSLPNFGLTTDRLSFDTTRDINAMVLYDLHKKASYEVYRTYITPNNGLKVYRNVVDRGIVRLPDSLPHAVTIRVEDDNQNASLLRFQAVEQAVTFNREGDYTVPVRWDKPFEQTVGNLSVTIPAEVLYESTLFTFAPVENSSAAVYSPVYRVDSQDHTPLRSALTLRITPDSLPERLREKACLASLAISGKGEKVYEGGRWRQGAVVGTTRTFGDYFIAVDTVAPRLSPAFERGADLSRNQSLTIAMRDDFSGIDRWSVTIDGEWALFDDDPKNHVLRHFFRDARYEKGRRHTLKATATDNKGNTTTLETEFFW